MEEIMYTSRSRDPDIDRKYEEALVAVESELGQVHPARVAGEEIFADETFTVWSPIEDGLKIGVFQQCGEITAKAAFKAACDAYTAWSQTPFEVRCAHIEAAADQMEEDFFRLAATITLECAKTRTEALAETGEAVALLRYYSSVIREQNGFRQPMPADTETDRYESVLRPYGALAVISPFNFPLALGAGASAAALITGNTTVMKPASAAPLSMLTFCQILEEAGMPEGAANCITGSGPVFGEIISRSPDCAGVTFTGSRDAGRWLQQEYTTWQPYPKPMILEMGSKNPCIVTAQADLKKAAESICRGAFGYSGQKCSATSRVYVEKTVFASFAELLANRAAHCTVGDPRAKGVFMGPLINTAARERFDAAVASVIDAGGEVLSGGQSYSGEETHGAQFAEPTIVAGIPDDHPVITTELFAPLVALAPFTTMQEALHLANDTEYGLTAGIFSQDKAEVEAFFSGIRFGVCYANREGGATTGGWPGYQSFGGWNGSGSTGKGVGGPYYLLSYMREQAQSRHAG
ncbi:aldehyde dehydrogenase family protein [Methanogenium organophilum]|uniref:L-glutamate gamma-semialdehyde dehydrogenase n=1 Tax=Methanogenium organophilum TaxID=2199 RepID=A0A9X9S607_METOG|nr:aldehyde dehydrogenase family protein [Methanogenium organophilum]WAI02357.1 aldehyde dehydrogenase family protein [Methanogenium organophilum]